MSWDLREERAKHSIVVTFQGYLDEEEGLKSVQRFSQVLGSRNRHVVFDVREMAGYDSGARVHWQRVLLPQRRQLASITVVGGGPIIRMGAAALGLALGVRVRSVETLDDAVPRPPPPRAP